MIPKRKKIKALLLFSGGLDSILAAKILEEQGVDVTALVFSSYFFGAESAQKSARENKMKLKILDFSQKHFGIIKKPKYGRGTGMNPCIDCHLLMLKEAKKIAAQEKYDFLATGEVLGQRPMSQNLRALDLIEKEALLVGKILRPLSAQVLPETKMEKAGLVDREKLPGISGRSRKDQLALAKKYKIKYFPTPAGGCILTDKEFSKKLRDLLEKVRKTRKSDIDLLRLGRHFWIGKTRIVLGRNKEENLKLKRIADLPSEASAKEGRNDVIVEPKNIPGPTALVRGKTDQEVLVFVKKLLLKYAKKADDDLELKIKTI